VLNQLEPSQSGIKAGGGRQLAVSSESVCFWLMPSKVVDCVLSVAILWGSRLEGFKHCDRTLLTHTGPYRSCARFDIATDNPISTSTGFSSYQPSTSVCYPLPF
jgi:hypothetical protein